MGVKDLWQLISPVGRRVSIETLEGKTLAIDMSIWLTQFIKAMRDEDGKMVKNAHIIGTLRRILKLLFHRIRPVFVFDGATPALKLRVIQLRRKSHEKSEQNRRSAIHRLLLAQLKQQITLQANSMVAESAKLEETANFAAGFKPASAQKTSPVKVPAPPLIPPRDANFDLLPHFSGVEEPYSKSQLGLKASQEGDDFEWTDGNDLPKIKNIDDSEEESDDGDDPVWTLPEDNDALDVDVLTSLPVGIRKRIIEDAKRRERTRSRATFMPVADNPILYSQTQLANFLQSSKLNRRFDEAHKKLAKSIENEGRAVAGENKRYQFVSRDDLKKGKYAEDDSPEESSANRRLLKRNVNDDKVDDIEDVDEEFTADDWARPAMRAVPKTVSSRLARKRRFIEELDEDRGDPTAATAEESSSKTETLAPSKSKSKPSQFRSRFFSDFDGDEEEDDVKEEIAIEESVTMKRPETFQIGRKVWQDGSLTSNRETAELREPILHGQEAANDISDLLGERAQGSNDDRGSDADSYGAGGGFFVDEGEGELPIAVTTSDSTTTERPLVPTAIDVDTEVRPVGQATAYEESASVSQQVSTVTRQTAQEEREAAEFRQMMWEDDEVDNIAWESDNPDENDNASPDDDEDEDEDEEEVDDQDFPEDESHASLVHAVGTDVIVIDGGSNESKGPLVILDEDDDADDFSPARAKSVAVIDMTRLDDDVSDSIHVADILKDGPAPLLSLNDDDDFEEMYGHRGLASAPSTSTRNDAALNRAISTASNMADWAGRVVRRVLKEHIAPQASSNAPPPPPAQPSAPSMTPAATLKTEDKRATEPTSGASVGPDHANDASSSSYRAGASIGGMTKPSAVSWAPALAESSYEEPPSLGGGLLQQLTQDSDILQDLDEDIETTRKAMATSARDAERITEEMKDDVLRLIQAFDLPFIIAPYEAEAQCAVLEELGVVDGVITEDSDSFLFGARAVYKNIFNDRKFVEAYYADDIAKEMGLSREDLIALAFFLGSDYTEGVHGIGIVNAMEILQAFSMKESSGGPVEGLKKFRRWLEGYDFAQDILESFNKRKTAASSTKANDEQQQQNTTRSSAVKTKRAVRPKGKKKEKRVFALGEVEAFCSSDDEEEVRDGDGEMEDTGRDHDAAVDDDAVSTEHQPPEMSETMTLQLIEQRMIEFEKKHKNGRSKWTVPPNFPDETVAKAYFHPNTNRNADPFEYIPPFRSKVRRYVSDVLGWSDALMDAQIDPVLQRFADRSIQMRVDSYYTTTYQDDARFAKIASERLRDAVVKITGQLPIHVPPASSPSKTAAAAAAAAASASPAIASGLEEGKHDDSSVRKKRSRSKATSGGTTSEVKRRRTTTNRKTTEPQPEGG